MTSRIRPLLLAACSAVALGCPSAWAWNQDQSQGQGQHQAQQQKATANANSRSSATAASTSAATAGGGAATLAFANGPSAPSYGAFTAPSGGGFDCPTVGFGAGGSGLGGGGGFGPSWISPDCNKRKITNLLLGLYGPSVAQQYAEENLPGVREAVRRAELSQPPVAIPVAAPPPLPIPCTYPKWRDAKGECHNPTPAEAKPKPKTASLRPSAAAIQVNCPKEGI